MNPSKLFLPIAIAFIFHPTHLFSQEKTGTDSFNNAEELAKKYSDTFKGSDVPTPEAYVAAYNKAKDAPSIDTWEAVAKAANSYANIVGVLKEHYATLYNSTQNGDYIHTAADYEKVQNDYLEARNNAYLEIAKIYLGNGDKANALSYAMTAVSLSGVKPNKVGEQMIRDLISYKDPAPDSSPP